MTEPFQETPDLFQFGRDMRRRAVIAPLVRERDFQPPRIARDHSGVGLRRTPERHEFARRRPAAGIDEGRGVAHRARLAALNRHQPAEVGEMRRQREHAARYLQSDIAVDAGRDSDRAAAIGCMRDRHCAGGNHRGAAGG